MLSAVLCVGLAASAASAQLSMLHTSGRTVVNANGTVVPLRGVNLGGLFVMEQWMSPLDSTFSPNDTYTVMKTLDNRFGVATEQSLISTYQNSWIQAGDLDNIKSAGFNLIRVPVWWGQFYLLNNVTNIGWRPDAFTYLDWLVGAAGARGIYVLIDMHGVVGSQTTSDDTGQQNVNQYWGNGSNQGNTSWMWWQIANHYNGNPTVAGYDLLNEPNGAGNDGAVIAAYNSLYTTVRSADPAHTIFIEGTFDGWNWSMLPSPSSQNWTNVVYSMHEYDGQTVDAVHNGANGQVSDFNAHASWNVPGNIGEFTAWNLGAPTYQYMVDAYNNAGLSWTMWTYKARAGWSWGYYNLKGNGPAIPNISNDSAATIAADWQQWTTSNAFQLNSLVGNIGGGGAGGSGISTSTWYTFKNQASALCLDDNGWGTANGTKVAQYTCGNQQANQEWQFQSQGANIYSISNRNAPAEVLDVTNQGTANLSPIQTWTYAGGANQQWTPMVTGNGVYAIKNVGSGRCLDVNGGSTQLQLQMQLYDCNNGPAQNWTLAVQP